jgi:hypothetical protein
MQTSHPMTDKQVAIVAVLLAKLEDTIKEKEGKDVFYENIRVLGSHYTDDVFINFEKIVIRSDAEPNNIYWRISPDGTLDDDALHNLKFDTLADRVHFFNELFEITIKP